MWECLAEYFQQLYHVDLPTVNMDVGSVDIPVADTPINEDPYSLTEAGEVISKLKGGKAEDICGIHAELLKAGGEPMTYGLLVVLAAIWLSSTFPLNLLMGVVIPLCKGRGIDGTGATTEASYC